MFNSYKDRPHLGKFIFSDRMAEICKATIGDTAYLFWEQFVVKGTEKKGAEFTWHQDSGYVDHKHKYYVNAWIPLDDVNEENGTVALLSYKLAGTKEKVEHKPVPESNDRVGYFGSEKGISANCPAGSIVVFSSTTFHRSGTNNTDKMRRAWALQYSPEVIYEADGSLKGQVDDIGGYAPRRRCCHCGLVGDVTVPLLVVDVPGLSAGLVASVGFGLGVGVGAGAGRFRRCLN